MNRHALSRLLAYVYIYIVISDDSSGIPPTWPVHEG